MSDQTLNQNLLLADLNKSMEWGSASVWRQWGEYLHFVLENIGFGYFTFSK